MDLLNKQTKQYFYNFLNIAFISIAALTVLLLTACGSSGPANSSGQDTTSGNPFIKPALALSEFSDSSAIGSNGCFIDVSHVKEGYVSAKAKSNTRLKLEVASNGTSMYFDLPSDGTPISAPLSLGNGHYEFTIWENTGESRYAEMTSLSSNVIMNDEFQPFIRPNVFCDYNQNSKVTELANELASNAKNQGDVVKAVYDWVVNNIKYDDELAAELSGSSGYIPNPDKTIADKKGICFDYASTVAALLRSQGIPCKIVTGNVAPDNVYHAWNMVYIDGTWVNTVINVKDKTWERLDTTFAAGGDSKWVGNGSNYTDRYIY